MTLRLRLVTALVLASSVAFADPPSPDAPSPDAPEGTMPAAPSTDAAPQGDAAKSAPTPPPPGELSADGTYTIQKGDTLWDLSQRFLDNPWYWPKIWADNPGVENPHWIYPGNPLRIRQTGAGLGAEVQPPAAQPEAEDETDDTPLGPGPADVADFASGAVGKVDNLGQDSDLVTASGRVAFQPKPMNVTLGSLITDRELASSGVITASFEQKQLLTTYDRIYVKFDKPGAKIGDTFSIFRPGERILHPVTHLPFGYMTQLIGTLKIVGHEGDVAVGEIGPVTQSVERGDRIGPAVSLTRTVQPAPNTKELKGVILATELQDQAWIAESHVVFVDKGAKDGVERGNVFDVVQSGDGLEQIALTGATTEKGMPDEVVAELMVFDVRDDVSAAMVVKSVREVSVGDRVEMHPAPVLMPGAGGD